MRAIIPVAGFGSRLRPHTYTLPKVLLNVAGKPILGHILDKIIRDGFTEATLIVGYFGDQVREYVRSNYDIRVDFVEQEERKGLAHAIHIARHTISGDPLLIILGDTIFDVDLKPVIAGRTTSIGVKHVEDPRQVRHRGNKEGTVTRLVEKPEHPTSNLAIVGLYWIANPAKLLVAIDTIMQKDIKTKGEYQLTDALQLMRAAGEKITTFPVEGWYDCGKPETLLSTNRHLLDGGRATYQLAGSGDRAAGVHRAECEDHRLRDRAVRDHRRRRARSPIRSSGTRSSARRPRVRQALLENSIVGSNAFVTGSFKRINIGDSSEIDFHYITKGPHEISVHLGIGVRRASRQSLRPDLRRGARCHPRRRTSISRVACESFVTTGLALVGGEITTNGYIEVQDIVRKVIREIGYTKAEYRVRRRFLLGHLRASIRSRPTSHGRRYRRRRATRG